MSHYNNRLVRELTTIIILTGDSFCHIGDMQNEGSVLEWLKDDDNRDLDGEIEAVNGRMLKKLMDESPFMAVFFCK